MPEFVVEVDFEGGYDHGLLLRAEVREGSGKHEIAMIDFPVSTNPFLAFAPAMTPVTLDWGTFPTRMRTFYGYVNHHETVNLDGEYYERFFLVGTSKPLDDPWPMSWKGVTASYIARLIAERHGLRAVLHNSRVVLPYVTTGQDSQMALLNMLADEVGYKFWIDGGTLYFVDPEQLITSPSRSIATEFNFDRLNDDNVWGIRSVMGSQAPVPSAPTNLQVFGLDEQAAKVIRSSTARASSDAGIAVPGNSAIYPRSVSSVAEAHRVAERSATTGTWEHVHLVARGDTKARVGSLVDLAGEALNQAYVGTWLVSDVTHVVSPRRNTTQWVYTSEIDLKRNQEGKPFFSSYTTLKNAYSEVPSVLHNDLWQSSVMESVYV